MALWSLTLSPVLLAGGPHNGFVVPYLISCPTIMTLWSLTLSPVLLAGGPPNGFVVPYLISCPTSRRTT